MAIQTATTGNLENASKEMIVQAIFTEEHTAPCLALCRKFKLEHGHDTLVVPKVGQMSVDGVADGEDIVKTQDLGLSTTSITTSEVGAKVILTDKLLRQNSLDVWALVGQQLGDGLVRKKEGDIIALFASFNGGTTLGAAAAPLSANFASSCVAHAKANKFGSGQFAIVHPNSMMRLSRDLTGGMLQGTIRPMPAGYSADRLANYWQGISMSGVPFFETGNITPDSSDDAIGFIGAKNSLGFLQSVSMNKEKERDASLRAWELVITADYGAFEIDDARGAPMTFDAAAPATS